MYKYYEKNGYNVMYHYFDSITEFLNYIDHNQTAPGFANKSNLASMKTDDNEWSGTRSLDEAKELAKFGYNENFDRFLELKDKLEKYIKLSSTKAKQFNYYIGYAPDVKAYLEGSPLSMLNKINPTRKQIDIYFNATYYCGTETSQIFNRGVVTLSIVEVLEKLGFIVNLNIFNMASSDGQIHYAVFRLKNTSERINVRKLFFPMCHNSWLRRLVFRLIEETPDITSGWNWGYGTPANEELMRSIIDLKPNDIVISQPSEMNVCGRDLVEDANAIFEHINRERKTEDFELPHLEKTKRR